MFSCPYLLRNFQKLNLQNAFKSNYVSQPHRCLVTNSPNKHIVKQATANSFEENNEEILDVYKERLKYSPLLEDQEHEEKSLYAGLNLNRGINGVFDIEDLVEALKKQQAEDIFVASVPKEIKYVDHMVVVSVRSQRHMHALSQFIRRIYKHKRHSTDMVPKLEGKHSADWMALDMGNIALHIFARKARLIYDLDSLWALGPRYDEECNKKEPISSLLENETYSLKGFEPAE